LFDLMPAVRYVFAISRGSISVLPRLVEAAGDDKIGRADDASRPLPNLLVAARYLAAIVVDSFCTIPRLGVGRAQ